LYSTKAEISVKQERREILRAAETKVKKFEAKLAKI
jgi:hypothetical protein